MFTCNIWVKLKHVRMFVNNKLHVYMYYCSQVTHQGYLSMATSVRLNDKEQEALRKKCVELNKRLINKGLEPIKDSELVHIILGQTIEHVEIGESGKIIVRNPNQI